MYDIERKTHFKIITLNAFSGFICDFLLEKAPEIVAVMHLVMKFSCFKYTQTF